MTPEKTDKRTTVTGDGNSYERRQRQMNQSYETEYRRWVTTLTAEDRDQLRRQGLIKSDTSYATSSNLPIDDLENKLPAPSPIAANKEKWEGAGHEEKALEVVRMVLASIFYPGPGRTVAYEVDIIGLAIGMAGLRGMTAVAAKHGVKKQAVSKACVKFCKEAGLPPSHYMRSEENREMHRQVNKRRTA